MKVSELSGWRRKAFAFALGVMAVLALPPFFIVPLLIPAFVGLYWLIDGTPKQRAFWDGWWWGWGYYMAGLYWFCIALLTEPDKFAWAIPFALFGLTGVIAIYCGIACWIAAHSRLRGAANIFIFSVVWMCVEFARGHLFSGFPWNLAGYSFAASDSALQLASLIGIYGLTWAAVFLATLPALFRGARKPALVACAIAYGILIIGTGWGAWRLHEADQIPDSERYVDGVMLRLVQANIAQHHKWDPKLQMKGLQEYIALTHSQSLEKVTHIIWPETAVPYIVEENSTIARMLGHITPMDKLLITGALRADGKGSEWNIYNSLVAIDPRGIIVGRYDKHKLVPFGEFLPFRSIIPARWLLPVGTKDFDAGPGVQTLYWPGLPELSPLICYEAIFPDEVASALRRPEFLLNVTNDAWFGLSTGPYQHFTMARMRAAEQGLPLVRVANTGISAVTDAYGRIQGEIGLGEKGILDIRLQKPQPSATTYSKGKNIFLLILVIAAFVLTLYKQKTQKD